MWLPGIRPISWWIEPVPKYVIEITLPDIEYLKSAVAVDSDNPKVISLRSFIREFQLNCPAHALSSKRCVLLNTVIAG
jgi:hypothetical protein